MFFDGPKIKEVFKRAKKERYGIVASNYALNAILKGIVQGADNKKSDLLTQISTGACKFASGESGDVFAGAKILSYSCKVIADLHKNCGIGLHIDHATPNYFDFITFVIENKLVSSVMIDASKLPFEENVKVTKEVVDLARKYDIAIEGEIGYIKGEEDEIVSDKELYTDPEEALEFVIKTGVDLFAASVGTNHGVTKGEKVVLQLDLIKTIDDLLIKNNVETGLVLHGASGLTVEQQQKAIKNGVVKINKDTSYQFEFSSEIQHFWEMHKDAVVCPPDMKEEDYYPDKKYFDPRKYLTAAQNRVCKTAEELIDIMGSGGKSLA